MPKKARVAETLPDLTEKFCQHVSCAGELKLSSDQLAELKRFSTRKRTTTLSVGAEFKGKSGWNHHTITVSREGAPPKVQFTLYMHSYLPENEEKERPKIPSRFGSVFATLAKTGEVELAIFAGFFFPTSIFAPAIVFPSASGLKIPLSSDIPVRITGLRLNLGSETNDSVALDVSNSQMIYVATSWTASMRIDNNLPAHCLERASSIAEKLVSRKAKGQ